MDDEINDTAAQSGRLPGTAPRGAGLIDPTGSLGSFRQGDDGRGLWGGW